MSTTHRFVRPRKNRAELGAIWIQMAIALFGGLSLFMGMLFTISIGYNVVFWGHILPGVSVAGVDVSGLSAADAAIKLTTTLTYPYSGRIVFRDGKNIWIETPGQLGLVLDAAASADAAASYGRSFNLFQNITDQLYAVQSGKDLPPVSILDQRVAHRYLQGLAAQIDRPVTEANLRINGLDVAAQPGQSGRA
ncbi:MAG: peptidoglycan binding domain-containing protein, partial [Anaerolineales bacterium]